MSRGASRLDLGRGNGSAVTNGHFDRPRSVSFQAPRGGLYFRDSSGLLFSMYSKLAEEEDNKMVDRWLDEAKGILIFASLFSAFVAALLSVSIPDLKPSSPFPDASTFSPSDSTIWVNSLWISSAVISLTCAMLATFVQKWARRYIRITQRSQYSPHKRTRLRAFFFDGVDKWHVSWTIEALPTLLHIPLFLFVGLLIYSFGTNRFVFSNVVWVMLSVVAYLVITFLPIFRPDCPYYAPLSSPVWYLQVTIQYTAFKVLSSPAVRRVHVHTADRFHRLKEWYYDQFLKDIGKTAEDIAWKQASKIDIRILESTFNAFGEVGAQEEFFVAIPGFFESDLVNGLEEHITSEFRVKFREALSRFLERTLSLSSVSEPVRSRRLLIGLNAARAALSFDDVSQILFDILNGYWPELYQSVETGHFLRRWSEGDNEHFAPYVQRIVAQVVVGARERDEHWISLVEAEYSIAGHDLRDYIGHGDSVLLYILIHMTRRAFNTGSWTRWALLSLSEFDIRDTLPELQHTFCTLWNDIVREARNRHGSMNIPVRILCEIRYACIDLHQGTDAVPTSFSASTHSFDPLRVVDQPQSYRFCEISNHRQKKQRASKSKLAVICVLLL